MTRPMSYEIMHLLLFVVIIKTITAYLWLEYNDRYDCVVSIAVDGNPVSVGVFITTKTVLTSANPLNKIGNNVGRVLVHYVAKIYNESYGASVIQIANDQSYRNKNWIVMGIPPHDHDHTTIHDVALVTIANEIHPLRNRRFTGFWGDPLDKKRRPYPSNLPNITHYKLPSEFAYAGFGYLDDEHVRNNTALEVTYVTADLLQDCDEWIPREWGRFLCILNIQNELALASGSPLFENGNMEFVFGIGCFTLRKGKENIHVFTDMKPYVSNLYGK